MLQTLLLIFAGKKSPADLPYSPMSAIVFSGAIAAVTLIALGRLYPQGLEARHYLVAILNIGIPAGGLYILFRQRNIENRFVQCITAIYGCNIIFNALLPFTGFLGAFATIFVFALFFYLFFIMGRIVAQTMEVKTSQGLIIIVGLYILTNIFATLLIPDILAALLAEGAIPQVPDNG